MSQAGRRRLGPTERNILSHLREKLELKTQMLVSSPFLALRMIVDIY